MAGFFLTRIASVSVTGSQSADLPGYWSQPPEVVAAFSDMTTFYPDGGRDTQSQAVSIAYAYASRSEATGLCRALANIKLTTVGGGVPIPGGDMRRWAEFYQSETHRAVFTPVTVQNPQRVTASFEVADYNGYTTAADNGRLYEVVLVCGTQRRSVSSGRVTRDPRRVNIDVTLNLSGSYSVGFEVTLSGGTGVWMHSEYALFSGGTVTTSGSEEIAGGTAYMLAVGR